MQISFCSVIGIRFRFVKSQLRLNFIWDFLRGKLISYSQVQPIWRFGCSGVCFVGIICCQNPKHNEIVRGYFHLAGDFYQIVDFQKSLTTGACSYILKEGVLYFIVLKQLISTLIFCRNFAIKSNIFQNWIGVSRSQLQCCCGELSLPHGKLRVGKSFNK